MRVLLSLAVLAMLSVPCFAQDFVVGTDGTAGDVNNWPGGEPPTAAIDGAGQKYLNFGKFGTGVAITPASGASTATSLTLWAANDSEGRDPASYEVWGSNESAPADFGGPGTSLPVSAFAPISVGDVMLPSTRNLGGTEPLLDENAFSVDFANDTAYSSYLIVFPTIKDEGENSMQVAEIQLFDAAGAGIFAPGDTIVGGQVVPEPAAGLLAAFAMLGALCIRKRR